MGRDRNPKERNLTLESQQIPSFYTQLRQLRPLGEAFVDESEQLSIPELIKRLITYDVIANKLNLPSHQLPSVEIPKTFMELADQRVALAVLISLCDCIVWWTQRHK